MSASAGVMVLEESTVVAEGLTESENLRLNSGLGVRGCSVALSSVALAVVVVMRRRAWNFLRNTVDGCLVLVLVLTFTCCMMSLLAVAIVAAAPTPSAFGVSVANDPPIVDKLAGASLALYFVFK